MSIACLCSQSSFLEEIQSMNKRKKKILFFSQRKCSRKKQQDLSNFHDQIYICIVDYTISMRFFFFSSFLFSVIQYTFYLKIKVLVNNRVWKRSIFRLVRSRLIQFFIFFRSSSDRSYSYSTEHMQHDYRINTRHANSREYDVSLSLSFFFCFYSHNHQYSFSNLGIFIF